VVTILMAYGAVAATAPLLFIAAGWRSRAIRARLNTENHQVPVLSGLYDAPGASHDQALGDVAEATHGALKRLSPMLAEHDVHLDVAIRPGLVARMRGPLLADMLEDLLTLGIRGCPGGMLLLTASVRGDRIYISLSDDKPGEDLATRQADARGLAERVALRGGALDLVVRPNDGTITTLRLAAAVVAPADVPGFVAENEFALAPRVPVKEATGQGRFQ